MLNKERTRRKRAGRQLIVLAVALLIAGTSAIIIPVVLQDAELNRDAEEYTALAAQPDVPAENESVSIVTEQQAHAPPDPAPCADFTALKAVNDDFIAWIRIPGTKVDYPVVLTDDVDYYLNHTFAGKESKIGTLFSLGKTDYRTPGQNIAVYGHHIRSGGAKMFTPLLSYKDKRFYSSHQTIQFDTLYHSGTYKVFAVINMRSGEWDPSATAFETEGDFLDFVNRAKAQSLYVTDVEVKASDQILTLITCDRSYDADGRLVLMAVKQ